MQRHPQVYLRTSSLTLSKIIAASVSSLPHPPSPGACKVLRPGLCHSLQKTHTGLTRRLIVMQWDDPTSATNTSCVPCIRTASSARALHARVHNHEHAPVNLQNYTCMYYTAYSLWPHQERCLLCIRNKRLRHFPQEGFTVTPCCLSLTDYIICQGSTGSRGSAELQKTGAIPLFDSLSVSCFVCTSDHRQALWNFL